MKAELFIVTVLVISVVQCRPQEFDFPAEPDDRMVNTRPRPGQQNFRPNQNFPNQGSRPRQRPSQQTNNGFPDPTGNNAFDNQRSRPRPRPSQQTNNGFPDPPGNNAFDNQGSRPRQRPSQQTNNGFPDPTGNNAFDNQGSRPRQRLPGTTNFQQRPSQQTNNGFSDPTGNNNFGNSNIPPTASTTPATNSNAATTRIPPRDPSNRIVFSVPCACSFTRQYSPMCGTDGQTYGNIGVMQCARQCGTNVQLYLAGACGSNNG